MPQFTKRDVGKLFKTNTSENFFNVKILDDVFIEHVHGFQNVPPDVPLLYLGVRQFKLSYGGKKFHVFLRGEQTLACHEHLFASSSMPIVFERLTEDGTTAVANQNDGKKDLIPSFQAPLGTNVEPKHPVVVRLFKFFYAKLIQRMLG